MGNHGIEIFFIGAVVSMFVVSLGFIFFTMFFFKYKRNTLRLRQEKEIAYIKAISDVEHEIKEETLNNIGRELHDNIGQILTVAKMQLHEVQENIYHEGLEQVEETLLAAVNELRSLSRSLNTDRVKDVGLVKVLMSEMERIDTLTKFNATVEYSGEPYRLAGDKEVIIYRILQEFISNTLKHSGGSELRLYLGYEEQGLRLRIEDNGHGFQLKDKEDSNRNGLYNMRSRARMIEAQFEIVTAKEQGTQLEMFIKKERSNV